MRRTSIPNPWGGPGVTVYCPSKTIRGFYIQPGLGVQSTGPGEHGELHGELTGVHLDRRADFCGACVTWRRPRTADMLETPSVFTNFLLLIAPCGILFKMASRASTFSTLSFGSDLSIRSFKALLKLFGLAGISGRTR